MFDFLKSDPVKKAKKHIDKALEEIEHGYPDFASTEYEKAGAGNLDLEWRSLCTKHVTNNQYFHQAKTEDTGENRIYSQQGQYSHGAQHLSLCHGNCNEYGANYQADNTRYHRQPEVIQVYSYICVHNLLPPPAMVSYSQSSNSVMSKLKHPSLKPG